MSMRIAKSKIKRQRTIIASLVLGVIAIGVVAGVGYQLGWWAPIGLTDTTTTPSGMTITLKSSVDGEDVSDFIEVSVWIPDDEDDIVDFEDVLTIANFDETEKSKNADDINLDVSASSYVWIEIDPDGESVFETEWVLKSGVNSHYTIYIHDSTSDVALNILDGDMDEITVGAFNTDGNYTLVLDCPHYTTSNLHANSDDWDVTDDDWDEMTTTEKEWYYDEANVRDQAPFYNPADDDEKDYSDDLERLTNAFACRLTMNGSISTTDGNDAQVNFTMTDSDIPAEVIISGVYVYIVWYETIEFDSGAISERMEIEFGEDIHLDNAQSGRLEVPRDNYGLGTFTELSAIGA